MRWDKNVDGYLICGTCHDKLGCEQICEKCFYKGCYASVDEWCDCWFFFFGFVERKWSVYFATFSLSEKVF